MEENEKYNVKLLTDAENSEEIIANMEYNIIIAGQDGNIILIYYKYRSWKINIIELYRKALCKK